VLDVSMALDASWGADVFSVFRLAKGYKILYNSNNERDQSLLSSVAIRVKHLSAFPGPSAGRQAINWNWFN
jgi:hypothetical protein